MYKIILLDYSMPELDGPEVAMRIRRLFQSNPLLEEDAVPFICCCTAYDEASFKRQALAAGMDQFMTKPLKLDELKQILEILKWIRYYRDIIANSYHLGGGYEPSFVVYMLLISLIGECQDDF